jgi:hypothetical protein
MPDEDRFRWDHLQDYDSDELFPPPKESPPCRLVVFGVIGALLRLPFIIAFSFSFYCVSLLIATFIAHFLTAYALAPVTAALDKDWLRLAAASISLFTSVPLAAFFVFILVKVFKSVFQAITGLLLASIEGYAWLGKLSDDVLGDCDWCTKGGIVWGVTLFLVALGGPSFWLTFFVGGFWVFVLGLIPFIAVALIVVWNIWVGSVAAFTILLISPCT